MSMMDDKHRYHPRQLDEIEGSGVSLINEPVREEVIELRPGASARSLLALLVGGAQSCSGAADAAGGARRIRAQG
jgi:hypothetical protein